jgi:hypothetical protein
MGREASKRLRSLASQLPALEGGIALECHLGARLGRTDLIVRAFRGGLAALRATRMPELAPARRFARTWAARDWSRVQYVDLEFDLDGPARRCLVGAMIEPRLHAGMASGASGSERRRRPAARAPTSAFAVAADVLRASSPRPLDRRQLGLVERCCSTLPPGGFVGHVGLAPRGTRGPEDLVRLIVSLPSHAFAPYMDAVGWPGDASALASRAPRWYGGLGARLDFDLNLLGPRLDAQTAFYLAFLDPAAEAAGLRDLLDDLRADGLVTRSQSAALVRFARASMRWPALSQTLTLKFSGKAWPMRLKAYLSILKHVETEHGCPARRR